MVDDRESGGGEIIADVLGFLLVLEDKRGPSDHGEALVDKEAEVDEGFSGVIIWDRLGNRSS